MSVTGVLPTVARDFVSTPDSPGCKHDRFRAENFESTTFPFVTKCTDGAIAVLQDRQDRVLHVDVDAAVHTVILKRANHFQTGTISDMCKSRVSMAAEIALQNSPILGAIEHCAPRFKLAHPIR